MTPDEELRRQVVERIAQTFDLPVSMIDGSPWHPTPTQRLRLWRLRSTRWAARAMIHVLSYRVRKGWEEL